jgi:methyl-accepting chemotaxis protein
MFTKLKLFPKLDVGTRLFSLLMAQGLILVSLGVFTVFVVRSTVSSTSLFNDRLTEEAALASIANGLRNDMLNTLSAMSAGRLSWPEGRETLALARKTFEEGWDAYLEGLGEKDWALADEVLTPHVAGVLQTFVDLGPILDAEDRGRLSSFLAGEGERHVGPFLDALVASTSLQQIESEQAFASTATRNQTFLTVSILATLIGTGIAAALGLAVYRMTTRAQAENVQLNDSVISLLEAVSHLSRRDLRVKIPVTEDVTGPVADSLNLLTAETAKVLQGVRTVSRNVAVASQAVKAQSDRVNELAVQERQQVQQTAAELEAASERMLNIARLAHASAVAADQAIESTRTAMETVTGTVSGINAIRDTIREAEKRIKRLGERSQEITGVVNLINTIAERTHILALNASMHAASAGEAGRGFAVVANEVQRLAESARDATAQISTLVNNIQVETGDTVTTMNDLISQVVNGSQLAEQAGQRMEETRESTSKLVAMVQQIASGSKAQAQISRALQERARVIQSSTEDTSRQLNEQSALTVSLVDHAHQLLEAVDVFRLPETQATGAPVPVAPVAQETEAEDENVLVFAPPQAVAIGA